MTTQRIADALRGILEIGKRDTTNPKYDGYWNEARAALAAANPEVTPHQSHFVNLYRPETNANWSKNLVADTLEASRRRRLPVLPGQRVEIVTDASGDVMLARVAETFDAKRPNDV